MRLRRRLRLWDTLASEEWENIIDVIVSATLNGVQIFLSVCNTNLARTNEYGLVLPSSRIEQVYEVVLLEAAIGSAGSVDFCSIPMLSHQCPLVLNVVTLGREDEVKIRKSKKQKGTRSEISAPRQ